MDRPSVAFARFLDSMQVVEEERHPVKGNRRTIPVPVMVCHLCGEAICDIEDGDTLRVLLNTALAHDCP